MNVQEVTATDRLIAEPGRMRPAREWFDIGDVFRMYRRHLWLFVGIVIACLIAAVVVAFLLPQRYEASARIQVDPQRKQVLDTTVQSQNFQTDQARVDTEVQLMQSADSLLAVTRRFELWRDPEFLPDDATQPTTSAERDALIAKVAKNVGKGLEVRRNGTSFIIDLIYHAPHAETAARLANAFAVTYVDSSATMQSAQARQQSKYLQRQMTQLGSEVRSADARIANYRAATGITQSGAGITVTDQQIGPIASELATAQSDAAKANATLTAARAQVASGSIYAVSDVLNSTVITQLRAQRAQLESTMADLNARYGPNHPDVQRTQSQLKSVEAQIADEANRIVARLAADAATANSRVAALGGRLGTLKGQQASNTRAAVTADSIQHENDANRAIYQQMAEQAQQTGQQAQVEDPAGTIVQAALVPALASFPNKKIFALAGLLCGILLSTVVVFAIDFMNRSLRTPEEMNEIGLNFLVSAPLITNREHRQLRKAGMHRWDAVLAKPMSAFSEAMRTIRVSLSPVEGETHTVVAIVSSLPAEGKTHIAVSLAQVCATSGDRAIIVDCDLRRPKLRDLIPGEVRPGLVQVLEGEALLEAAIGTHPTTGLDVISLAGPDFTPKDLLASDAFMAVLDELRTRYNFVLLDCPPVLAVSSTRTLARRADAVIYVAKWNDTPRGAIRSGVAMLNENDITMLGGVLSMVDTSLQASLSENDPAYYRNSYSSYYQD